MQMDICINDAKTDDSRIVMALIAAEQLELCKYTNTVPTNE